MLSNTPVSLMFVNNQCRHAHMVGYAKKNVPADYRKSFLRQAIKDIRKGEEAFMFYAWQVEIVKKLIKCKVIERDGIYYVVKRD